MEHDDRRTVADVDMGEPQIAHDPVTRLEVELRQRREPLAWCAERLGHAVRP
jgi:hypothetical protein